jgi:hypothetical protein
MSRTSRNAYGTLRSHAIAGPPRRLSRGPRSGGPRSGGPRSGGAVGHTRPRPRGWGPDCAGRLRTGQTPPEAPRYRVHRCRVPWAADSQGPRPCRHAPVDESGRGHAWERFSGDKQRRISSNRATWPAGIDGAETLWAMAGRSPDRHGRNQIGPCRRPCRLSTRHGPARHDRPRAGACWHEVGGRPPPSGTLQR